jgi:hypothetical protein
MQFGSVHPGTSAGTNEPVIQMPIPIDMESVPAFAFTTQPAGPASATASRSTDAGPLPPPPIGDGSGSGSNILLNHNFTGYELKGPTVDAAPVLAQSLPSLASSLGATPLALTAPWAPQSMAPTGATLVYQPGPGSGSPLVHSNNSSQVVINDPRFTAIAAAANAASPYPGGTTWVAVGPNGQLTGQQAYTPGPGMLTGQQAYAAGPGMLPPGGHLMTPGVMGQQSAMMMRPMPALEPIAVHAAMLSGICEWIPLTPRGGAPEPVMPSRCDGGFKMFIGQARHETSVINVVEIFDRLAGVSPILVKPAGRGCFIAFVSTFEAAQRLASFHRRVLMDYGGCWHASTAAAVERLTEYTQSPQFRQVADAKLPKQALVVEYQPQMSTLVHPHHPPQFHPHQQYHQLQAHALQYMPQGFPPPHLGYQPVLYN